MTELSRWGRSAHDVLGTLNLLAGWQVSVVAINGMTFELDTPYGRMMTTVLAGVAPFECDLISGRVKSGLTATKARGKKPGRQPGQRPKSDRLAPKVPQAVSAGRGCRWIARDPGIGKNTVLDIVKRRRKILSVGFCPYPSRPEEEAEGIDRELSRIKGYLWNRNHRAAMLESTILSRILIGSKPAIRSSRHSAKSLDAFST